jgi:hypothetical protein
MRYLCLTHPGLVDVRLRECDGRWLAAAGFSGELRTDTDRREAIRGALTAVREPYANELARSAELED